MKKGWKKVVTSFLTIGAVTLLGACGSGSDSEESQTVRLGVVGENNEPGNTYRMNSKKMKILI